MTIINHQSNNFYLVVDYFFLFPMIHLVHFFYQVFLPYLQQYVIHAKLSKYKFLNNTSVNLSFIIPTTMPSFKSLIDHALFVQSDTQFFYLSRNLRHTESEYSLPVVRLT